MSTIEPWVGSRYCEGVLGSRVLIVGDSNYDKTSASRADDSKFVRQSVDEGVYTGSVPFFTKIATLVLRATTDRTAFSRHEIQDLWNRVAFTNYVQTVLPKNGIRPTREQWETGRVPLTECVIDLRPDLLLVLGADVKAHLEWLPSFVPNAHRVFVDHPTGARGWSYDDWVDVVRKAFSVGSGTRG